MPTLPRHLRRPALRLAVLTTALLSIGACDSDSVTEPEKALLAVDPVLKALSASGDWEVAANPVALRVASIDDRVSMPSANGQRTESSFALAAEADRTWYAADGKRYDALYINDDGKAYGRRAGARRTGALPTAANDFGAFTGNAASFEEALAEGAAGLLGKLPEMAPARIWTNWQDDRRYRVSTGMTTFPTRVMGQMSSTGNTQDGGCSGTKIGPRAVLTAAHCVMDSTGTVTLNGWFNPGQTSTTRPNGSIRRNGVFLRDWRVHRKYDYAVVYLDDSPATVGLGWMGIVWWNNSAGYNGKAAKLFGYPCGANRNCGSITEQRCKDSPRADKRCDGWMYGHSRLLDGSSFRNDELLQYDNDMSSGQSGSAVWTWYNNTDAAVMAVNTHSWDGVSMGARFRQSMWDDVCSWIAHPLKQSAYATHSLCH
jgi:V8-like Glu-specific endopeptidase